jgi:drug/metabolite transporter (DMT)-like permease
VPHSETSQSGITWLLFALMTVASWGVYGIFLHRGQVLMADPANGRYKAFLFVGLAYFLTAVLAPVGVLLLNQSDWKMPNSGMGWSLLAGTVGAVGAFCVLLAFGAKGTPAVVMTIVFAGAPIVNAVVGITMDRNWGNVSWPLFLGIILAAFGGGLVTYYKPPPPRTHAPPAPVSAAPRALHR